MYFKLFFITRSSANSQINFKIHLLHKKLTYCLMVLVIMNSVPSNYFLSTPLPDDTPKLLQPLIEKACN